MIKVGKKVINADLQVILEDLRAYIYSRTGKSILKDIKPSEDNIMVTCPFHKDGNERKPSCGISTIDKEDKPAGTVHCFTCGYTGGLDNLISKLLNYQDSGAEGRKWLLDHYETSYNRQLNIPKLERNKKEEEVSYISEEVLKNYRFYHPYMYKRGLTNEIIEKYDIGYDSYSDMITFPVRDIYGNCLFVAKRSVKGKMFVLPSNKNKPVYGLYELNYKNPEIYICESFFNALTLAKWGYNAVAMMGTGSRYQYDILNNLPFRVFHLCLDGDGAGRLGSQKLMINLRKDKLVYEHVMLEDKDVNDLTKEEFLALPLKIRSL